MTKAEISQRNETPKAMETPILTRSLADALAVDEGPADAAVGEAILLLLVVIVINVVGEDVAF